MSKTLIYLIAIFALWMYFSFGNFSGTTSRGGTFGNNRSGSFGSGSGNNRSGSFGSGSGNGGMVRA